MCVLDCTDGKLLGDRGVKDDSGVPGRVQSTVHGQLRDVRHKGRNQHRS